MNTLMLSKKIHSVLLVLSLLLTTSAMASTRSGEKDWSNSIPIGVTHMLPSVTILPAGSIGFGTSISYGVLGVAEVGTDLYLDFVGVTNIFGKVPLWSGEDFGIAVHASYVSQDVKINSVDPNTGLTSTETKKYTAVTPGVTVSYRIMGDLVGHSGFKTVIRNPELPKASINKTSGYLHGNELFQEFGYALTDSVAVAPGISYDTTYNMIGYGATLHVPVLSLGVHYYPSADENKTLISLGIGVSF